MTVDKEIEDKVGDTLHIYGGIPHDRVYMHVTIGETTSGSLIFNRRDQLDKIIKALKEARKGLPE